MGVELPSPRDPRLHVALVLLTVQVLGQVVVEWDLSIAQLLLCLGSGFVLEVGIVAARRAMLAWPASALLTANGVALLLRVPGTEHGDWWSLRGAPIFVGTTALAVASKHVLRVDDRPLFNPSNLGLVACFLALGVTRAEPQDLWWGPWSVGLAVTYAWIIGGIVVITRRLGLLDVVLGFFGAFAVGVAAVAATGHAITARWHAGPLEGIDLWRTIVLSPETFVFAGFMITDPRTVARGRHATFGAGVGVLATVLLAPQHTEAATKVAILAALVGVCALRPRLERHPPGRLAVSTLGVIGLGVAVLVASTPGASVDRPHVEIGPAPEVRVDRSLDAIDLDAPENVATDLLEDLALEALSLEARDVELAATAAVGRRLATLEAAITAHGDVPSPPDDLGVVTLGARRPPGDGQASPQITATVDGHTYVLVPVGSHWLIADELAGDRAD